MELISERPQSSYKPSCAHPLIIMTYIKQAYLIVKNNVWKIRQKNWPRLFVWKYVRGVTQVFLLIHSSIYLPESLETVSFCLVRQDAAEGKEESIIFRYCFLARFRMSFSSLTGTEFEPDDSSFCPGQTKHHSLHHIFLLPHHYS